MTNNKNQNNQNQNQNGNGKEGNNVTKQENVTKEVMQEIKEVAAAQSNSNQFDLDIATKIVDGSVKKTELTAVADVDKAKLQHEAQMKFLEVHERLEIRKMELENKLAMTKDITSTATCLGMMGAFAAMSIVKTQSSRSIQLEKIKQGIIE
jgi:hypothetical protein